MNASTTRGPRRWRATAAVTVLALFAFACGGDDGSGSEDATDAATDTATDTATSEDTQPTTADASPAAGDSTAAADPGSVSTDVGVTDDTISLGVLTDLSGPNAAFARPTAQGFKAYFDSLNDEGGIAGRTVEIVEGDHKYDPQVAVQEYQRLEGEVLASQVYGTPPVNAILGSAVEDSMVVVPAAQDSKMLNEANVVFVAPPYSLMVAAAIDHIVAEEGTDIRVGAIFQADDLGDEHRFGIDHALAHHGMELVAEADAGAADQDFTAQVAAMQRAEADYVITAGNPLIASGAVGTAAGQGYEATFVGAGASFAKALLDTPAGPALEQQFVTSCILADWGEDVAGMQTMLEVRDEYAPDQAPEFSFEYGYVQAMALHAILEQAAASGDMTRSGVVAAIEATQEVETNGMTGSPISFGPEPVDRIPYRDVRMCDVGSDSDSGFVPTTDWFVGESAAEIGVRN